jgi:hypothetical protein
MNSELGLFKQVLGFGAYFGHVGSRGFAEIDEQEEFYECFRG